MLGRNKRGGYALRAPFHAALNHDSGKLISTKRAKVIDQPRALSLVADMGREQMLYVGRGWEAAEALGGHIRRLLLPAYHRISLALSPESVLLPALQISCYFA